MKLIKFFAVALALLAIFRTSSFAPPVAQNVPDYGNTMGLLGVAFASLVGLRAWLNK